MEVSKRQNQTNKLKLILDNIDDCLKRGKEKEGFQLCKLALEETTDSILKREIEGIMMMLS